jgi:hypothetical protein
MVRRLLEKPLDGSYQIYRSRDGVKVGASRRQLVSLGMSAIQQAFAGQDFARCPAKL